MKTGLLICILVLKSFSSAHAQLDTGVDGIGIYFDEQATSVAITADGSAVIAAYVILTNPSAAEDIVYWGLHLRFGETEGLYGGLANIRGEPRVGVNSYISMPGTNQSIVFSVVLDGPDVLAVNSIMVLADLQIHLLGEEAPVQLFFGVSPDPGYSVVSPLGPAIFCVPSTGAWDIPVAVINGDAPVGVVSESFSTVKALFRSK